MKNDNFQRLVKSLSLAVIQPTKIDFERKGSNPTDESEVKISWRIAYPEESYTIENGKLELAPLFEISYSVNDNVFYSHKTIILVILQITDEKTFSELWNDEQLQKTFKEKQLRNTLWPIVRQQVLDGMSRLALPPIAIPWLFY